MIDPWLLFKSISAGIAVAAPGLPADFTFAGLEACGLTALSTWLLAGGDWLRLAGALVLLYFAARILRARPDSVVREKIAGPGGADSPRSTP